MKTHFTIAVIVASLLRSVSAAEIVSTNWPVRIVHPVKDAATHAMLRTLTTENDPAVRAEALAALRAIGDSNDLAVVRTRMQDTVPAVRAEAQRTMAALGAAEIEPAPAATAAAIAATQLRQTTDAGLVLSKLPDRNVAVREEAVRAAQRLGLVPAIPLLLPTLEHPDSGLRSLTCETLGQLQMAAGQSESLSNVVAALATQLARDTDPDVRRAAGAALVAIHAESARAALLALLEHGEPVVRRDAAVALGDWREPALAGKITPLLDAPEPDVAAATAEALGKLKNPDSVAPLVQMLAKAPAPAQERAAWACGEFRATASVPSLIDLLIAPDEAVQLSAIRALGRIRDARATPHLRSILVEMKAHEPAVRAAAIESLIQLVDRDALKRVFQLATERVVPALPPAPMPTFDASAVRIAALRYLSAYGDARIGERLLATLTEPVPGEVRPALAATATFLTGKPYHPLPDQDHRRYLVESLAALPYEPWPAPPSIAPGR